MNSAFESIILKTFTCDLFILNKYEFEMYNDIEI